MNDGVTASQVRAARALLGMTQDELALISGITRKTLARLERGHDLSRDATSEMVVDALRSRGIFFTADAETIGVAMARGD